jgi:hypothetical protein
MREDHPIASKIPENVWRNTFSHGWIRDPSSILPLFVLSPESKLLDVDIMESELDYLEVLVWAMVCYPNATPEEYIDIARRAGLRDEDIFWVSAAMGHLENLIYLKKEIGKTSEDEELKLGLKITRFENYKAFQFAAENGHTDILSWWKKEDSGFLWTLQAHGCEIFQKAAQKGDLKVLDWFAKETNSEIQEILIKAPRLNPQSFWKHSKSLDFGYGAFSYAAENGDLSVMNWLKEKYPKSLKAMIQAHQYEGFRHAAGNGHLSVLLWYKKEAPKEVQGMIKSNYYDAFQRASSSGHLLVLKWLITQNPRDVMHMLEAGDLLKYTPFILAAENGHLKVLEWFQSLMAPEMFKKTMEKDWGPCAFNAAAHSGHVDILNWFKQEAPLTLFGKKIRSWDNSHSIFARAIESNNLRMLAWLKEHIKDLKQMIGQYAASFDYSDFRSRKEKYHFLKWLKEEDLDQFNTIVGSYTFRSTSTVCQAAMYSQDFEFIDDLFRSKIRIFHYAESHVEEYGPLLVNPFIWRTLAALHAEQEALLIQDPNAIFNVHSNRTLYYFIIQNIIRRQDPNLDDELRFLLSIPSLREIANANGNELICLAVQIGNETAARLLLEIPAVRREAEENNFYRREARGNFDLGRFAQDRESSMIALSVGEKSRLQDALAHYQEKLNFGAKEIFEDLLVRLRHRYLANPATIIIDDVATTLPCDYMEFQALNLAGNTLTKALLAYYQHPDHTALRYLSKPNYWMHPGAAYVNINEQHTERWSTFDEYKPLISLLYLAAMDEETPAMEGYTLETRLDYFIRELALIGRAHNWDKSRERNHQLEEYDDLEGDRPSCFSGVKRRLFQSVQGHPLLVMLTKDQLRSELASFVFDYFKSLITDENKLTIKVACEESTFLLDDVGFEGILRYFDISKPRQEEFIKFLEKKYGSQFHSETTFLRYLKDMLALQPKSEFVRNRYHITKLGELAGIYPYLSKVCEEPSAKKLETKVEIMAEKEIPSLKINSAVIYEKGKEELKDEIIPEEKENAPPEVQNLEKRSEAEEAVFKERIKEPLAKIDGLGMQEEFANSSENLPQENQRPPTELANRNPDNSFVIKPAPTSSEKDNPEVILESLQAAINDAVKKYTDFLDNPKNDNRGAKLGLFTRFRHGEAGRLRANDFKSLSEKSETAAAILEVTLELLDHSATRYNNHSFGTYLLDELKPIASQSNAEVEKDLSRARLKVEIKFALELMQLPPKSKSFSCT